MQKILILLSIIFSLSTVAQTSLEHMENGIEKHNKQDFKGAIKEYDKAIKADQQNKSAYFNRGTCELALKDYKSAMSDFSKAIEIDPKFVNAYYSRASVFASQEKYVEALPDLDKTIELDPTTPNVLTLRGQIRAQTGNLNGACDDFNKAKQIGDKQADKYLAHFCSDDQLANESLVLNWPGNENWKVGSEQENEQMTMVEMIHSDETLENWTELGTMISVKGIKNVPVEKAMNMTFEQSKQNAPKATLTLIEKDETSEFHWIIFTIESPSFKNDTTPESQVWYIVQGKSNLYTNCIAVKKAKIPEDLKEKWVKFLKTSKVESK